MNETYSEAPEEAEAEQTGCSDEAARKIQVLAEHKETPLYEDKELIKMLHEVDLEEDLPPSFFEIVNEVFLFLVEE